MFQVNGAQPFRVYRLIGNPSRVFLADELSTGKSVSDQRPESLHAPGARDLPGRPSSFTALKADEARITNYLPNRVEVDASAHNNCLLVLLDGYYPGWKAMTEGGRALPVGPSPGTGLIQVKVPGGMNRVQHDLQRNMPNLLSNHGLWHGRYVSSR
jgi:hypothetical protein